MKCPYCAEEIQNEAVFCRYCSAVKKRGGWLPPPRETSDVPPAHRSRFTMRSAAFFFFFSAVAELASITDTVSLFGSDRSGVAAIIYHLLFIAIYSGMGLGLWSAKTWGFQYIFAGTVIYSLDRVLYLWWGQAAEKVMNDYGAMLGPDGQGLITQVMLLITVLTLVGWWGFLGYLYFKRDYFKGRK